MFGWSAAKSRGNRKRQETGGTSRAVIRNGPGVRLVTEGKISPAGNRTSGRL